MNPLERRQLGSTGVSVTTMGLGGGPLAGLFEEVTEQQAAEAVERAFSLGIRFFDTAPLYGHGLSERRIGRALSGYARESYVLASKVGRLLVPLQAGEAMQTNFAQPLSFRPVFDYSYDGVMRSFEASLERLGLERIDILYVHDPDGAFEAVMSGAYPALERLRSQGAVRAIGAAMNQWQMLARFAHLCDFDCFLLASRYTLLDQSALSEFLPLCVERHIPVVIGAPFNSGILATGATSGARFEYRSAQPEHLERVRQIEAVCTEFGVPLRAAALQFPTRHPAVCSVIPGCRSAQEVEESIRLCAVPIDPGFWDQLSIRGLLRA